MAVLALHLLTGELTRRYVGDRRANLKPQLPASALHHPPGSPRCLRPLTWSLGRSLEGALPGTWSGPLRGEE